jgi:hypothetical protein
MFIARAIGRAQALLRHVRSALAAQRSTRTRPLVRAWMDDAVEHLARMEYTCALDVLDDNPEGIGPNRLARLLSMAKQSADYLTHEATNAMRRAGVALGDAAGH